MVRLRGADFLLRLAFRYRRRQLGLGDYRVRGPGALERWVELVLLAYVLASLSRWGRKIRWQAAKEQSAWQVVSAVEDGFTRLVILCWVLTIVRQVLHIPWLLPLS